MELVVYVINSSALIFLERVKYAIKHTAYNQITLLSLLLHIPILFFSQDLSMFVCLSARDRAGFSEVCEMLRNFNIQKDDSSCTKHPSSVFLITH